MKKLTALILSLIIILTAVGAGAQTPEFLTTIMSNYTAEGEVSLTFDSSEELIQLFEEMEMPEEVSRYIDLEALLRTLLAYDETINVQADMSDDFQKVQMALTGTGRQNIEINQNLKMAVDTKTGMWIDMDLSDETEPVFDIIYCQPFMNKYMKMNGAELMEEEGVFDIIKSLFQKEYMEALQKKCADIYTQYAQITPKGSGYVLKMDNAGFIEYVKDIITVINAIVPEEARIPGEVTDAMGNLQFLGEDGLVTEVTLTGGKLSSQKITADVSIDISKIYEASTGEEWEYEADGVADFTLYANYDISGHGKTKVKFPDLTDENSFTYAIPMAEPVPDVPIDYNPYPKMFVSNACDYLGEDNGTIYFPLREAVTAACGTDIMIDFDNGKITMSSGYFKGYKTIVIDINSDKVLVDGVEHFVPKPMLIDGTTYASREFYTEILGWGLNNAGYDFTTGKFHYSFSTYYR